MCICRFYPLLFSVLLFVVCMDCICTLFEAIKERQTSVLVLCFVRAECIASYWRCKPARWKVFEAFKTILYACVMGAKSLKIAHICIPENDHQIRLAIIYSSEKSRANGISTYISFSVGKRSFSYIWKYFKLDSMPFYIPRS